MKIWKGSLEVVALCVAIIIIGGKLYWIIFWK